MRFVFREGPGLTRMHRTTLSVTTRGGQQMVDVTQDVRAAVQEAGVADGFVTLFVPHTTAAVTVNENADPDVQTDLLSWLAQLVPKHPDFRHYEGNSDGHIKSSLVGAS